MNPFSSAFSPELISHTLEPLVEFPLPLEPEISRDVAAALAEDVGLGDLTASLIPEGRLGRATVVARESAVLCGTAWFDRCFTLLDPKVKIV